MIAVLLIILVFYIFWLMLMLKGWSQLPVITALESNDEKVCHYSILIPVRNEAGNILNLLRDMGDQIVDHKRFEVIIVDDHSEDNTVQLVEDNRPDGLTLQVVQLPDLAKGKKNALQLGIEAARGKVIITTDGDCRVGPYWLAAHIWYFENTEAALTFGPVMLTSEGSFFENLQIVEFAPLVGVAGASLALGWPNMCNGANLAFRKDIFHEVGGYSDTLMLPSGDDEFLMHKVFQRYEGMVHFIKDRRALVTTPAKHSWSEFQQQRKRWAGKWPYYKNIHSRWLAVLVALTHVIVLLSLVVLVAWPHSGIGLAVLLLVKVGLEFVFVKRVLNYYQRPLSLLSFLFLQITYPFYAVYFGATANFGSYVWKGRHS